MKRPPCQRCGREATRVTTGTGHACAVYYDRPAFYHCATCPWPDNYLWPKTTQLAPEEDS